MWPGDLGLTACRPLEAASLKLYVAVPPLLLNLKELGTVKGRS